MATRYTDAFRGDGVHIAISSGLTLAPSHTCCACVAGNGTAVCLQAMSIRRGQVTFSVHFLWSRRSAFARISSLRITAVKATFFSFPAATR
ncbi:MAG: hypothetical protein ACI9ND_002295 [Yoonia sp.]|jgi:hypothetical protein